MKSVLLLCLLLILSGTVDSVSIRDPRGRVTENQTSSQATVLLKLDKNHFYQNQDIHLEFIITNRGDEVITLFPGMKLTETYQLTVKDENDTVLPVSDSFALQEVTSSRKTVNFAGDEVKEVILHKNESFSKKILLNDYYDLKPGKKYYIAGYFYPNRYESSDFFIRTRNTVSFLYEKTKKDKIVPSFTEYYAEAGVSPEEVVHLFLGAEKNSNWKNYFKWMDLEEFILAYDKYSGLYSNADDEEKFLILEEFKKYLTETRSGKLAYYKILSADRKSETVEEVKVYVERHAGRMKSRFEYNYTLKAGYDNNWKIANVVVKVKR